jgi:hypothetical protein
MTGMDVEEVLEELGVYVACVESIRRYCHSLARAKDWSVSKFRPNLDRHRPSSKGHFESRRIVEGLERREHHFGVVCFVMNLPKDLGVYILEFDNLWVRRSAPSGECLYPRPKFVLFTSALCSDDAWYAADASMLMSSLGLNGF